MKPDLDKYLPMLERYSASDADKRLMLEALYSKLEQIVDAEIGDHPVAAVDSVKPLFLAPDSSDLVRSNDQE